MTEKEIEKALDSLDKEKINFFLDRFAFIKPSIVEDDDKPKEFYNILRADASVLESAADSLVIVAPDVENIGIYNIPENPAERVIIANEWVDKYKGVDIIKANAYPFEDVKEDEIFQILDLNADELIFVTVCLIQEVLDNISGIKPLLAVWHFKQLEITHSENYIRLPHLHLLFEAANQESEE